MYKVGLKERSFDMGFLVAVIAIGIIAAIVAAVVASFTGALIGAEEIDDDE